MPAPTQVARPWRATARTIFAALVGFAAMWGVIVEALGLNTEWQWVSASLLVTGAVTRVMALPAVESFLSRFFPWLAADPDAPYASQKILGKAAMSPMAPRKREDGQGPVHVLLIVFLVLAIIVLVPAAIAAIR